MNISKKLRLLLVAGLVGFNTSYAASIQVDLSGSVTSLGGASGPGNGVINVGDAISYSFTFDEQTTSGSTGVVRYLYSITDFTGSVGSYLFSGNTGDVFLRNDSASGTLFGGNPFDQISISNYNAAVNSAALGLTRDDFTSTSGNVAGYPLRSVSLLIQTDDTTFLSDLNFSEQAMLSTSANLPLLGFSMFFMDGAFGSVPVSVDGSFSSMTVTNLSAVPVPAAVWLFASGLMGMVGVARRASAKR